MYEAFYGFRQRPFSLNPDPDFLYLSKKHRTALSLLEYSLLNQAAFSVITGEIGTGKTTLIRHLLHHMEGNFSVGLITNTHANFGELLQWALMAFGLEYRGKGKVELYQLLYDYLIQEYAKNRRVLLIIDEAQNLGSDALEELRMLSNINTDDNQLLQMMLVGQPGLRSLLKQSELEQFAQRIAVDYHLQSLDQRETYEYIYHRIEIAGGEPLALFDWDVCGAIYLYSHGVPRLINLLLDTALVYGFAEQKKQIGIDLIQQVVRDKQQGGIFPVRAQDVDIQEAKTNGQLDSEVPWPPEYKVLTAIDGFGESSNEKEVIEMTLEQIGYSITKNDKGERTDEWPPAWEGGKEDLYTADMARRNDALFEPARNPEKPVVDTRNKGRRKYRIPPKSNRIPPKSKGIILKTVLIATIALLGIVGVFFSQSTPNSTLMQNTKGGDRSLNTNSLLAKAEEKPVANSQPAGLMLQPAVEKADPRVSLDSGVHSVAARPVSEISWERRGESGHDVLMAAALDQEINEFSSDINRESIKSVAEVDRAQNSLRTAAISGGFSESKNEVKRSEVSEKKRQVQRVTVQEGDSLTKIIVDTYGGLNDDLLREILQLNPHIRNRNILFVGQTIKLPVP